MQEQISRINKTIIHSVIFNFDNSFNFVGIDTLDLTDKEEIFRYYCSIKNITKFSGNISDIAKKKKTFFLGSGDLHHISYSILKTIVLPRFQIVVFDNHPDNMIFPSGIHCGSWVYHASKLPNVSRISVIGIGSKDISGPNIYQNHYGSLRSGKVKYYCLREIPRLASYLSKGNITDVRSHQGALAELLLKEIITDDPVYLSIDKDVLSEETALSSWDQGCMSKEDLMNCIKALAPKIFKADVCGDLSSYTFKNPCKKFLRFIDGGETKIPDIGKHRKIHAEINLEILSNIG
jgi:arginase family enzyme